LVKGERPVGVVLIAVVNIVIYAAVLAWVLSLLSRLSFVIIGSRYFLNPYAFGWDFYLLLGVAYCVAAMIGVVSLLRDWRSFRWTAMTGYAFECVLFAIIGFLWGWLGPLEYGISWLNIHYVYIYVIFGTAAAIAFKIASVVYLARKKTWNTLLARARY
jgi:hypothetical protein